MITVRPTIFCFLGRIAADLYVSVPLAIRRRLGLVPEVFAFLSVTDEGVDLKVGTHRPKLQAAGGALQNRLWNLLTYCVGAIGNIRIRTDALRRPADSERGFQVVRGGPDVYLVQCLSDPMGWELLFAIAEKIRERNDLPTSAGRARGVFPLFHLPSVDEDAEREQALEGLRRLEGLVARGVLFPSIVVDRVNRNGYPLEKWEDLTELLSEFLALGSSSEAAPDIWGIFPQVADLRAPESRRGSEASGGISAIGLSRFRFNREVLGGELARFHLRDLKRALSRSFGADSGKPDAEDGRSLVQSLLARRLSRRADGLEEAGKEIVEWVRAADPARSPTLGTWSGALDRLQKALFELLGDVAQRIENARQDAEACSMESPLRDAWIARLAVKHPAHRVFVPWTLGGALAGTAAGLIFGGAKLSGYLAGGAIGALGGLLAGWLLGRRALRDVFTLGEFPDSAFTQDFSVPRTLQRFSRSGKVSGRPSGMTIQIWGELRNQLDPALKRELDERKAKIEEALAKAREEEGDLVFLDRAINVLREALEGWRARLAEVEVWEPRSGFSGDIFPSDGPRRIYEWFQGREAAEKAQARLLALVDPLAGQASLLDLAEETSSAWGRERAEALDLRTVLDILDDRPEDLVARLTEASAPLWPRPGDRDELMRCFGEDFVWLAKGDDLRSSVRDEAIFIRVLGNVSSAELART
ncbi:MAG: hypothetical protein ACUVYA_03160 [Planctomycetota bacterium]